MLYHYTSIQALEGILRESPSEKGLCFWASRYDCFGDKEEYKIGFPNQNSHLLLLLEKANMISLKWNHKECKMDLWDFRGQEAEHSKWASLVAQW